MISDEDESKIQAFIDKHPYNFKFVRSTENLKSVICVFPATIILNQDEDIVFTHVDSFEKESKTSLKKIIEKYLDK